jgi:hypothetical protein
MNMFRFLLAVLLPLLLLLQEVVLPQLQLLRR